MHVNEAALQAAIAKTVIEETTDETRKEMFLEAIKAHLFTQDSYSKQTQLSKLFEGAMAGAIRQLVVDYMSTPEVSERLTVEIRAGVDLFLQDDRLLRPAPPPQVVVVEDAQPPAEHPVDLLIDEAPAIAPSAHAGPIATVLRLDQPPALPLANRAWNERGAVVRRQTGPNDRST